MAKRQCYEEIDKIDKAEKKHKRFRAYVGRSDCPAFLEILEKCTGVRWTRTGEKPTQHNPFDEVHKDEDVLKFYYTDGKLSVYEDDGITKSDEETEVLMPVEFIQRASGYIPEQDEEQ